MITREDILKRAEALQKQAERLRSDLDATLGAIQDCGYWLEQLRQQESADGGDLPSTS
jgi:prefoldin subunit 5